MCKTCIKLRAEGAPKEKFPVHNPSRPSLEERQRYVKSNTVEIPAHWASNSVRSARLRAIRKMLNISCAEYASLLGISEIFLKKMENGARRCALVYVRLAESELRILRAKEYSKKRGVKIAIQQVIEQPAKDARIKSQVLLLRAKGMPVDEIADLLKIHIKIVTEWAETLD